MAWQHHFQDIAVRIEDSGLPKPLLKRLVFDTKLTVGSRILLVGCENVQLARLLDGLGIDVTFVDENPDRIAIAKEHQIEIEIERIAIHGTYPYEGGSFDGVIVTACAIPQSESAFRAAACEWAALLRPAAELHLLPTDDRAELCAAILGDLPGDVESMQFGSGGWLRRGPVVPLTTLRIPSIPMPRDDWHALSGAPHAPVPAERSAA